MQLFPGSSRGLTKGSEPCGLQRDLAPCIPARTKTALHYVTVACRLSSDVAASSPLPDSWSGSTSVSPPLGPSYPLLVGLIATVTDVTGTSALPSRRQTPAGRATLPLSIGTVPIPYLCLCGTGLRVIPRLLLLGGALHPPSQPAPGVWYSTISKAASPPFRSLNVLCTSKTARLIETRLCV